MGNNTEFAIVRYNSDGSLDNSYGIGGKVIVDVSVGDDKAYALALDSSGRAALAGEAGGLFGVVRLLGDAPPPTPTLTPSTLQFSQATYSVAENVAAATATRTGDTSSAAAVTYSTSNGTATAGQDYTSASSTLNFAVSETSRTFNGPLTNDSSAEGNETLNLTLSNATGGAVLGAPSAAVLIITDDASTIGLQYYPLSNPVRLLDTRP